MWTENSPRLEGRCHGTARMLKDLKGSLEGDDDTFYGSLRCVVEEQGAQTPDHLMACWLTNWRKW